MQGNMQGTGYTSQKKADGEKTGDPSQLAALQAAFEVFDVEKRGVVKISDLESCLKRLHAETSQGATSFTLLSDLNEIRKSKSTLSWPEFRDLLASPSLDGSYESITRNLFPLFDRDGTGYISVNSLRRVCEEIGESLTDAEITEMIKRADKDGDGFVNADDFYSIISQRPL